MWFFPKQLFEVIHNGQFDVYFPHEIIRNNWNFMECYWNWPKPLFFFSFLFLHLSFFFFFFSCRLFLFLFLYFLLNNRIYTSWILTNNVYVISWFTYHAITIIPVLWLSWHLNSPWIRLSFQRNWMEFTSQHILFCTAVYLTSNSKVFRH